MEDPLKIKFRKQRHHAKKRGVEFLLTFDEWFSIWQSSGHLAERGRGVGQYCMARFNDIGPYAVGNVEIVLSSVNTRLGNKGRKAPLSARLKMREFQSTRPRSHRLGPLELSLARRLLNKKYSQERVAELLGVSQPHLSRTLRKND